MSTIKNGNLLDATEEYIVHQCNCKTNYPKGLSKEMFKKFPSANDYKDNIKRKPGTIKVHGRVINLFGQKYPGKPRSYETKEQRIEWFKQGLDEIKKLKPNSLAFPYQIGCGLAGGEWDEYYKILKKLENDLGILVVIYKI